MLLDELLGPSVGLNFLLGSSIRELLHLLLVLCSLHGSTQHAERGLQRHGLRVVFVYFRSGFRSGDGRVANETAVGNFSFDVHVHGAVHDDNHRGHSADHQLVVVHNKCPIGDELEMSLHVTGCFANGFEFSTLSIFAGHPAA